MVARVLIVDDANFTRKRTATVLSDLGYDVREARGGAEAVRVYAEWRPDAVLLDINMPETDGLEALAEIRKFDKTARVAMITAHGQPGNIERARELGARDFVLKPVHPERLKSTVERLLAS